MKWAWCIVLFAATGCTGRAEPKTTFPGGADLEPQMVRVIYANELQRQLEQRVWHQDTLLWSDAAPVLTTSDPVNWVAVARSTTTSEEMVGSFEAAAGAGTLRLGRRDLEGWHDEWAEPAYAQASRGFDLAYESASGDALVVFAAVAGGLAYRHRPAGGNWAGAAPVDTVQPTSAVHWVVLASRPASDEIALVYLTADQRLEALLWQEDGWNPASAVTLDTQIAALERSRAFDAVYEDLSGDLMVLWGHTNSPENVARYAAKPADSLTWPVVLDTGSVSSQVTALTSEVGSDRIAAALTEGFGDDDVGGMIWHADAWSDRIQRLDDTGTNDDQAVGIAWLGSQGAVALVYEDRQPNNAINWGTWSGTGWQPEPDLPLPNGAEVEAIEMRSLRSIHGAMLLVSTPTSSGQSLFAATISLGVMAYSNQDRALSDALPGVPGQAFDMIVR